jgi:Cu(I)/Ag(I) efflux system membrane fusion protein
MNNKTIIIAIVTLAAGFLLGWLIFGGSETEPTTEHLHDTELAEETLSADEAETWTCSMHPQIRQPEPGDCPICGMDLIPLDEEPNSAVDANAISMSPTAMQLANIETAIVGNMKPVKETRLDGKIAQDERRVFSQSSHIPGRIEDLMVNFTGDYVSKGQVIATVYSPELVTAQEELFEAQKIRESQPRLFQAAKEKLKSWKLNNEQIGEILSSGKARETFDILADVSGYVIKKMVNPGDYVQRGETIYQIADLSHVWVLFDVYESDMPWISKGDKISFTVSSLPGQNFEGTIDYIDPVINPKTRVAKARVVEPNPDMKLKPGMFVSGKVKTKLSRQTEAPVVPKTAVMWTGTRSVVYVKSTNDQGVYFTMQEVELGPALGESYIIQSGLQQGDEIATNGTFSIDAAAQLAGKPSMMNPTGGPAATGHRHGSMQMDGSPEMMQELSEPPEGFVDEFQPVLGAYFSMKDALVQSDLETAQQEAAGVSESLDEVMTWGVNENIDKALQDALAGLNEQTTKLREAKNIDQARKHFIMLSDRMIALSKIAGPFPIPVYVQFCPMANQNQGAYWLSKKEQIRNPYYGDMMLTCGEVRDVIKKETE